MQTFKEFQEGGDLLKDFNETVIPPSVDRGTRFANYIIDLILVMVVLFALAMMSVLSLGGSEGGLQLASYIIMPLYYVVTEGLLGGRSVGKMVTGTVAIRTDGAPLTWGNIFGRSFSRLVPFEALSALFGEPWHDKWTNTTVVKKSQLVKF